MDHYSKKQLLNTNSDNTMLPLNRINALHQEASDFGSSDGTNMQLHYPNAIHELISPHSTALTNSHLRKNLHTTKNFEYQVRIDRLMGEVSRNH